MRVLRDDVVRLCEDLGFVAAGQWKRQKMQDMLRKIAGTDGIQDKDVEGDDLQALLHEIVVLKGDVEVVRTAEELGEAEPKREEAPAEAVWEEDAGPEPEPEPNPESETQGEPADEATDEADCVPIHQPEPKKRGRKGKKGKAKAEAEQKPEPEEKPKGKQKKAKEEKAKKDDWYTVGFKVVRDLKKSMSVEQFSVLVAERHGTDKPLPDYILDRLVKAGVVFGTINVDGDKLVPASKE